VQIVELSHDSNINANGLLPVVAEWWTGSYGSNAKAASTLYRDDSMLLVMGFPIINPTTHVVYTIDTTDPSNLHVIGELSLPVTSLNVYSLHDNWVIGICSFDTTEERPISQPIQLVVWNALDPTRLAFHWKDDTVLMTNGTGINSTTSHVISNMVDSYASAVLRYIEESNVLVLPVRTETYETRPCSHGDSCIYRDSGWVSSEDPTFFNHTCLFNHRFEFDGFWFFKVDLASSTADTSGGEGDSGDGSIRNITKYFAIDHATPELLRRDCTELHTSLSARSLAFNGDVMTFKRGAILSTDLLTKGEAAPAVFFGDCD
jgi:hypothetical protein